MNMSIEYYDYNIYNKKKIRNLLNRSRFYKYKWPKIKNVIIGDYPFEQRNNYVHKRVNDKYFGRIFAKNNKEDFYFI